MGHEEDEDPVIDDQGIGLDAAGLAGAFPFHFVVDDRGTVVQVGPALARLAPDLQDGPIGDHFEPHRGQAGLDLAAIAARAPSYELLRLKATGRLWRGQTLLSDHGLVFVGTPWFVDTNELAPTGLTLDDFALHDPIAEYLALLEDKNTALRDAKELSRDLRNAQRQLQTQLEETLTERQRLEALVRTVPWGVLVEDIQGQIVITNQPFCRLFGITSDPKALSGTAFSALAAQVLDRVADREGFAAGITAALSSGVQVLGDEVHLENGQILERDYVPISHRDGFLGHLWQYREVTERHRARQLLEEARHKAEAANTAKSEFLAMMSHEMRTPLGVIVGIVELLQDDPSPELLRSFVQRLGQNSRSLLQMIDTSLDFARLEQRQVEIEDHAFSPDELLEGVADSMGPSAEKRRIRLLSSLAPTVPTTLLGDSLRLRQILVNLVNNAVKFTNGSEIQVRAVCEPSPRGDAGVSWTVRDQGPGIPREQHDRIFERFFRAKRPEASRSGTGLGLAICRELASAMGGTISIESDAGHGTTFRVWLPHHEADSARDAEGPLDGYEVEVNAGSEWTGQALRDLIQRNGASCSLLAEAEADAASLRAVRPDGSVVVLQVGNAESRGSQLHRLALPLSNDRIVRALQAPREQGNGQAGSVVQDRACPARVLLVDDDPDSVDICSLLLARLGISVVTADGVDRALQTLRTEPFDLVLTDLRMPNGGGLALIQQAKDARQARAWPNPPFVILTAEALEAQREHAREAGADGYMTKPIDPALLQETIEQHVDRRPIVAMVSADEALRTLAGLSMQQLESHRFVTVSDPARLDAMLEHYDIALVLLEDDGALDAEFASKLQSAGARTVVTNAREMSEEHEAALRAAGCADVWRKPVEISDLYVRVLAQLSKQ